MTFAGTRGRSGYALLRGRARGGEKKVGEGVGARLRRPVVVVAVVIVIVGRINRVPAAALRRRSHYRDVGIGKACWRFSMIQWQIVPVLQCRVLEMGSVVLGTLADGHSASCVRSPQTDSVQLRGMNSPLPSIIV